MGENKVKNLAFVDGQNLHMATAKRVIEPWIMAGLKKGNVDSDIIFHVMKKLVTGEDFDKILIVSGDGDYKQMIDFLISINRFEKILLPDRDRASSLYKKLGARFFAPLDTKEMKAKIEKKIKKAP